MWSNAFILALAAIPIIAVALAVFYPITGVILVGFALSTGGLGIMFYQPDANVLGAIGFGLGLALIGVGGLAKLLADKADWIDASLADQPTALAIAILDAIDGRYSDQGQRNRPIEPARSRFDAPVEPTRRAYEPRDGSTPARYSPPRAPEAYRRPPLPEPPRQR
ncbi:hypothetical protein [Bauldia litoralis]|uniref:hypothetical protein n=1 Tax=Bauldia litoralis TaxID=665467 RepID=UPI0032637DC7